MSDQQGTLRSRKPLTAEELAQEGRLAMERKERGDKRAMEEFGTRLEDFVKNASPDSLRKFVLSACTGNPEAEKEYGQLCSYFNAKAMELARKPKQETVPGGKPLGETASEKLSVRPAYTEHETDSTVNGNPVRVLSWEAYAAYVSGNPDALARLLAKGELSALEVKKSEARKELEKQKIHIVNSGNYPQGWDSAVNFHEEAFRKQAEALVAKRRPDAEAFRKFLETDRGSFVVGSTERAMFESEMKADIRKGLGISERANPESSGEKLTGEIYAKTGELLRKIGSLRDSINRDVEAVKSQHATMLRAWGGQMAYERAIASIPDRYGPIIRSEMAKYAKDVGKHLVLSDPTPEAVLRWQRFSLPLAEGKVTLDFGNLGNVPKDKETVAEAFEAKFDSVYRDTWSEHAFDSVQNAIRYVKDKPWETAIDVWSVIISWVVTGMLVDVSGGTGLLKAGVVYTGINNAVSGTWYAALGKARWKDAWTEWLAGMNVAWDDTKSDVVRKKAFELASNTVLFGAFKTSSVLEHAFRDGLSKISSSQVTPELLRSAMKSSAAGKLDAFGTPVAKLGAEAGFFTLYVTFSQGVEKALKQAADSGLTPKEAADMVGKELASLKDPSAFMDLYTYNLSFVGAVKLGLAGGKMPKTAIDKKKLWVMESNLRNERRKLEDRGYSFATRPDGGYFVFDPYGHKADPKAPEFAAFMKANSEVADLSLKINPPPEKKRDDDIYGPENGRWGKIATNPTNLEQKFLNLSKNAEEAEKWGLPFALRDETVYSRLEKSGVSEWAGVSEWLMKKSGFEEFEIRSYREGKMKWSNEAEREALKKMEVASEKVAREYFNLRNDYIKNWSEALARHEPKIQNRILVLLFK